VVVGLRERDLASSRVEALALHTRMTTLFASAKPTCHNALMTSSRKVGTARKQP
jgi:hypothetical protein